MERYVLIDHTADMMVRAFGSTLEECFGNAAYALFDQTVDLSNVGTYESVDIRVTGIDDEDRLFSFLSEMLFIEDADVRRLTCPCLGPSGPSDPCSWNPRGPGRPLPSAP